MIERLVEHWLTSAGERGYETAFAQLLASEGHKILQPPVHHPYEHGKDILTLSPDGELHAHQLKGPDLTHLSDFEKIQAQLLALAGTAVSHPSVRPARRADRVFLVTTATLSPPVRDRITAFNNGISELGFAAIEPVEREQLLNRFTAAQGRYLPQELSDLRTLLELYYSEAESLFPVKRFAQCLSGMLPLPPAKATRSECRRALSAATVVTSLAVSSWQRHSNNLGAAQGWLTLCSAILHFAEVRRMSESHWRPSYDLALEAARAQLSQLLHEVANRSDLLMGGLTDGLVYGSRALHACGYLGAYFLSECSLKCGEGIASSVGDVLRREYDAIRVVGEADVAPLLIACLALENSGQPHIAERMALTITSNIAKANQRYSRNALPDPYHTTEDILTARATGDASDADMDGEEFDGRSYTLHVLVAWLARRLLRQHLALFWEPISRITFCEFEPSAPACYLAPEDPGGVLRMWPPEAPQSWQSLLARSRSHSNAALPRLLQARREFLPYLPLLFPYRLTATLAQAIDRMATDSRR